MEDTHITELDLGDGVSFFGVYDGHGGKYRLKPINVTCLKKYLHQ